MKEAKGFGAALREARLARGWSQPELATRAGLSSAVEVSRHETGRYSPTMTTAEAYAKAFGVSVSELIAGGVSASPTISSTDLATHADRCESDRMFEAAAVLRRIVREMESARCRS